MDTRTPTPQGISALLKRAGFERAAGRNTEGFSTGKIAMGEGAVRVQHWFAAMSGPENERRTRLEQYAGVITEAGYAVRIDEDGRKLLVATKER